MSYHEDVRRHRRLAILRHLEQSGGYTSNASILTDVLAGVGLRSTRAQVTTELIWLQETGFVQLKDHGDFVVATATQEGIEVAQGLSVHPDIQRPRPRA